MKKYLILLMILAMASVGYAQRSVTRKSMTFYDIMGDEYTGMTSVTIYDAGTSTVSTLFSDRAGNTSLSNPITTGLGDGTFEFYSRKASYKMVATDGTDSLTIDNLTGSNTSCPFWGSYIGSLSSYNLGDDDDLVLGTGSDWTVDCATAGNLLFTPIADNALFQIGASGTTLNSDFIVYVGTGIGLILDAGNPSLAWTGGACNINVSSNFNTAINSGTSTGSITLGSSTSGAWAIDGTSTGTINADDSIDITVSAGTIGIASTGGDITIDGTDKSIKLDCGEAAAADGIVLVTTGAGSGIDITSLADIDITTTGAAGEDITITNTGGSINITATEADAGAILIQASAAGGDVNIDSVLGRIEIEAEEDAADAIYIIADGGTSSTLTLFNDTGTAADSIELLTDVGGITATASAGAIVMTATGATAGDITLTAGDDFTIAHTGSLALGTLDSFSRYVQIRASHASLVAGQSGTVIVSTAAAGSQFFELPGAAAGLIYTFVDISATAGDDVNIKPATGDSIGPAAVNTWYHEVGDALPACITLLAVNTGSWVILNSNGTWVY